MNYFNILLYYYPSISKLLSQCMILKNIQIEFNIFLKISSISNCIKTIMVEKKGF